MTNNNANGNDVIRNTFIRLTAAGGRLVLLGRVVISTRVFLSTVVFALCRVPQDRERCIH